MGTPLVLRPVVPVLDDVVDRYLTTAELAECLLNLGARLVTLTTLPEAQRPLGVDGSLTRQCAVAGDNLVGITAGNEVIVHVARHLGPDAQPVLLAAVHRGTQSAVADASIRFPLDAQLVATTLHQLFLELIGVGVPCRTPAFGHYLLATDIHLDITGIVEDEVEARGHVGFDKSLVDHLCAVEHKALRQVFDATRFRLLCQHRLLRRVELVIERVLLAHQCLTVLVGIGTSQVAFRTFLIIKFEDAIQLLVVVRITEASVRISIPQDAIVLRR